MGKVLVLSITTGKRFYLYKGDLIMSEYNKDRYYWFKLKEDFFKRHDIRIIKSMPNGKDYVIFYLQLLCESLSHNGRLRFSEAIPYDENMLSVITDTNIDIVRSAMKLFIDLKMIEILDDQTIYIPTLQKMVGSTTLGAEQKQLQRQRNALQIDGGQSADICPPEIEIEKEREKEIYKEKEKKGYGGFFGNKNAHFENERTYTKEELDKLVTNIDDVDF